MDYLKKEIIIHNSRGQVFNVFFQDLMSWWPKDYTWSNEVLKKLKIERKINGLCSEIGPHNFRCDWGRVLGIKENEHVDILWQINPHRAPEPNPAKASNVKITFIEIGNNETKLMLEHSNFKNHGEGHQEYISAMNSEYGWELILRSLKKFAET